MVLLYFGGFLLSSLFALISCFYIYVFIERKNVNWVGREDLGGFGVGERIKIYCIRNLKKKDISSTRMYPQQAKGILFIGRIPSDLFPSQ